MDANLDRLKEDLEKLIDRGELLYNVLALELNLIDDKTTKKLKELKLPNFKVEYESWYSEAQQVIKQVLPDRFDDFIRLYKNEKRKEINYSTYTISDYLIGLQVTGGYKVIVDRKAAFPKFEQQRNILKSVQKRFESSLYDLRQILQAELFDDELETAEELLKNGFVRAAGSVAGVVLEKHLKEVCKNHNLQIKKKNPCISDYNDILKNEKIIDIPTWRHIQYLGDIRNLCDHCKDREPNKEEVDNLISGVKKVTKTLY
jgi:hypothetical protein